MPIALWLPALADTYSAAGFSVDAPTGWTKGASPKAPLVLYAPNPMANFRPNVNVLVQETGKMTNQQYYEITKNQAKQVSGSVSDYSDFVFDNKAKGKTLRLDFASNGTKLSCLSVWLQRDGKTYLITGTTIPEDYANRLESFKKVARSFRFADK